MKSNTSRRQAAISTRVRLTAASLAALFYAQAVAQTLPPLPSSPAPVTTYEYDAQGNPTKTIQAPGVSGFGFNTVTTYDSLNQAKDSTNAKAGKTQFGYDGGGRLNKVTDPRNLITQYPRNGLGEATQLISPDTGSASHTYDEAGNLKTRTDSRGVLAAYSYDNLNRLTSIVYSQSGQANRTYSWTYDQTGAGFSHGIGRLTSTASPAASAQYAYDAQGRLSSATQTVNAAAGANSNPVTHTTGYEYDAAGKVTAITYPSGRKLTIGYTTGQPNSLSLAKDASSTPSPIISQIQWAPFGGAKSWLWHLNSGTQLHEYTYDSSGRLVRYPLGGAVRDLSYDAADRITGYTHYDAATGTATAAATALNQSFGYDELGRLTTLTTATTSATIAYDANGNRTSLTLNGNTSAYTTSSTSNRLTATTNPARTFNHDNAGNTTSDSASYTSTYSLENRLASLTKAGTTTAYSYDAGGQRIRKVSDSSSSTTTLFVYDQDRQLVGEYDNTGQAIREYVWLGSTPIAVFTPNGSNAPNVYFIHVDHLNTPRIVVDSTNQTRWRWLAEPFGNTLPENDPNGLGAFTLNLRFPGQYFDSESGLHYNYFRDYDASVGRYVQSDPIGLQGGINTYAYVEGNPLSYVDPNGENAIALGVRSFGVGWRIGQAINPYVQPMIASALDAIFLSTPLTQEQEREKDLDYELYKWRCDKDKPPPGLDKCEEAKWQRDRAKQCRDQRQRWDDKWWPGRHATEIKNVENRIRKWEKIVQRECGCP
jgi:RHS repeat-associated protein